MSEWNAVRFFATAGDIQPVIRSAEGAAQLQYILAGLFDAPGVLTYPSAFKIDGLSISKGSQPLDPAFLILKAGNKLEPRSVPQKKGGIKFAIDALNHEKLAVVRFGGQYKTEAIISGELSARQSDGEGMNIQGMFLEPIKANFKAIKGWYVGPEAERLFQSGYRLTANIKSPKTYDLTFK